MRGINLGSHNRVPMPRLRSLLAEAGLQDVATYLQSGNVVLTTELSPDGLAATVEQLIAGEFGLDVPVITRSRDELADVVAADPFNAIADDPKRYQVTFCASEPPAGLLGELEQSASPSERVVVIGREIYTWQPDGIGRSKLWAKLAGKGMPVLGTARNWTTVRSLLELAGR